MVAFTLPDFIGIGLSMEDFKDQPHHAEIRGLAITAYTFGFFIRWIAACFAGKTNFFPSALKHFADRALVMIIAPSISSTSSWRGIAADFMYVGREVKRKRKSQRSVEIAHKC